MKTKRTMPIIISTIIFLVLMLFLLQESGTTLWGQTRNIPQAVKHFTTIPQNTDPMFEITALHDKNMYTCEYNLFMKENGEYIIELRERGPESSFQIHYFRISSNGEILDIYKLPEHLYFKRGYIVGEGSYCNWTADGDTTIYKATPIDGKLSKEEFLTYYNQSSTVCSFDKEAMLLIDGKWYFAQLDFWIDSEFRPKGKLLHGEYPDYPEYFYPTHSDKSFESVFTTVPQTVNDLEFCFFKKESYSKARHSVSIGSPTGGSSQSEKWSGTGYFKLSFPQSTFCFKHEVEYVAHFKDWNYRLPFELYKTNMFAIMSTEYRIYLIRAKQ